MSADVTFQGLVDAVAQVHMDMAAQAGRAVNLAVTVRNWVTGAFVVEFEQHGEDRAAYGERVLARLADELEGRGIPACEERRLRAYRQFYLAYPTLCRSAGASAAGLREAPDKSIEIWRSLTAGSHKHLNHNDIEIRRSAIAESGAAREAAAKPAPEAEVGLRPEVLLQRLSYTHFELLAALESDLKRAFYEVECVRGAWSVRELKRQIAALYFERSTLSREKGKLAEAAQETAEQVEPRLAIRDPYVFEFLGLKPGDVLRESDLEEGLLERLQAFLLELGHGFCFEARQKRILIGDAHGFVDLVFYHRILKCHVLVELKVDAFSHEYLGQLNTYVSWYGANMMAEGDNPPVGLLLCTERDEVLVEYALAGLDNRLFVSKYQLELPSTEALRRFITEQRREVGE